MAIASLAFLAGCGGSTEQKSVASSADIKAQVGQVCSQATSEIDGLPDPLDTSTAAQVQRQSAQIFKTASGKLNELATDVQLPASYRSWLDEFEQLPALNEQAAEAFSGDGIASGRAAKASEAWYAQAEKANGLAKKAGLTGCIFGQGDAG